MAWCEADGQLEPALHYAHGAGATEDVTRLLEQLALPTYFAGGVATLESWLDWYDDELRERYPTIAVIGAWVYILTGRPAEGARWERSAQRSTATPGSPTAAHRSSRGSPRCADTPAAKGSSGCSPTASWRSKARPRGLVATGGAARRRRRPRAPRRPRARPAGPGPRDRAGGLRRRTRRGQRRLRHARPAGDGGGRVGSGGDRRGAGWPSSNGPASPTTWRAGRRSPPQPGSPSITGDLARRAGSSPRSTGSGRCSTTGCLAVGPDRPRARARPSRARRARRRGHGAQRGGGDAAPPPAIWARWTSSPRPAPAGGGDVDARAASGR